MDTKRIEALRAVWANGTDDGRVGKATMLELLDALLAPAPAQERCECAELRAALGDVSRRCEIARNALGEIAARDYGEGESDVDLIEALRKIAHKACKRTSGESTGGPRRKGGR